MCTETETKLELKYFYPTVLEVADICVADQEIKIKMIAHSKECILLMLSLAVMISLCHADMRLPGYLSWNVSCDGAAIRPYHGRA